MNPVVKFSRVFKSFKNLQVLENLSFEVYSKDVVGIFGQSGGGKTTLLKLAAGLVEPTSGSIDVKKRRIGYVFQEPRVLPWKTALDNVVIPLLARGFEYQRAKEKAAEWLLRMGLEGFENYFPARLSGGMVQRISLARAFAVEPDVLLLDEPFGALDLQIKETMFSLLKSQLKAQPTTVLYVSHVPEDVVRIATRIFVLTPGGEVKEIPLMEHEALVDVLKGEFLK